jgi:hypothetical protein
MKGRNTEIKKAVNPAYNVLNPSSRIIKPKAWTIPKYLRGIIPGVIVL